jgi:alpha-L-fucosidase
VQVKGGAFKENFKYTAKDIRFTTQGKTLYAIALGWPADSQMVIRSLAKTGDAAQNQIEKVELLGRPGELKFTQTADGLAVELPGEKLSDLTCSLRITGSNLKPASLPAASVMVTPDSNGCLTLGADDATLHGTSLKLEEQGGKPDIGFWDNTSEWVSWRAQIAKPGTYQVSATVATANGDAEFVVGVGGENLFARVPLTAGWDKFSTADLGTVEIKSAGDLTVSVRARDAASWKAINLNAIRLTPVAQ